MKMTQINLKKNVLNNVENFIPQNSPWPTLQYKINGMSTVIT